MVRNTALLKRKKQMVLGVEPRLGAFKFFYFHPMVVIEK